MNITERAVASLNTVAEYLCQEINEGMGDAEYSGVKPHILLALTYMEAVRRLYESLHEDPSTVSEAKEAANRVSSFPMDKAADWIISGSPHDRVEIVKVDGMRYVAVSTLLGSARPLWALFHSEMMKEDKVGER